MDTALPSPDDLQREYTQLQDLRPACPIDTTRQTQTLHDILTSDAEAATFAKLAAAHPEILSILKGTENGEHTVFVPVNEAWQAAAVDNHQQLGTLLAHVSTHFVSDAGFRHMPNVPTLYTPPSSNGPHIIRTRLTPSGLDLNHKAASIVRANVRASNGIIHYVDHVLLPPPSTLEILRSNPQFSYFHKAVTRTGTVLHNASSPGGTLFAPDDAAFTSLGPETLSFLFTSDAGLPYLRALVQMHYCPEITFFCNLIWPKNNTGKRQASADEARQIKGRLKYQVATSLADKQKSAGEEKTGFTVVISRFNGLICMAAAGGAAMVVDQDIATGDGVLHAIQGVLTPDSTTALPLDDGTDTLEALKKLYGPFVA